MTNKPTTEDLSLDCRDLAKNPALTERNRRMLAEAADRLMALERERDFARFREDSARNVMRKYMRELERLRSEDSTEPPNDKEIIVKCGAYRPPVTNADRIRAMSDEELAELLCTTDWCEMCGQVKQDGTCHAMELGGQLKHYCKAAGLHWLQQPAPEEGEQ